jgi:hypothetical protein
MAGLGYKDFTVGQVLTSAEVDGYLMQQTIMKFADAAARNAALTSVLAEGMFAYLADTNATEYYDGSSWVSISNPGDITAVTAGTGISGGGTSGSVTITNSMATAIDAKGDLIPGTGADTFGRLVAGTNETRLVADSGETTGLKYVADTTNYAVAAKGDLLVGTAADTLAPLTVGTDGHTLVADSGAATGLAYSAGIPVVLNAQTATYTAVLGDAYKLVTMSNAAANDFLIPTNANVAFPVGTVINVVQIGAGTTTIEAVTSGTTTISSTGATATAPELRAQFSAASCVKVATDTWYIFGDIS